MNIDVSIIIVNYNTCKLTCECIDSIYLYTKKCKFEVIVIDNASIDDSKQIFSADKRIVYIYLNQNIGFGQANNEGARHANGNNLMFLNPDTRLIDDSISVLSHYLYANMTVGVCGGNLLKKDMKPNQSFMRYTPSIKQELHYLTWNIYFKLHKDKNLFYNYSDTPIEVGYITGADLMVKKNIFNRVNGFDKIFFLYYEETDLCDKIHKLGYRIMNVPQSKIIHYESQSIADKKSKFFYQSRQLYLHTRYSIIHVWVINILHGIWEILHNINHKCRSIWH